MAHNFSLKDIRQIESHFKLNLEFKPDKTPIEISYETNISHQMDSNNVLNVVVAVNSSNEQQPFTFSMTVLGKFQFKEKPKDEEIERIAKINCASIIYPYLRESVADLTRRASLPPFHLDIVNFLALYEANKQESKSVESEQKDTGETACKK